MTQVGHYTLGKTLGQGAFGKVKEAVDNNTNRRVAMKILDKNKIQEYNMGPQVRKEITVLKMVKHPAVIELYEVLASDIKIFIVMELVTGGELLDRIVTGGRFTEDVARHYFKQLISALACCHALGVCHRDLKPENILLDNNGSIKISDFGLAAINAKDRMLTTTCGTPNYVAPEVLQDKGYLGEPADIWSAGVILYVMLSGFLPFDEPQMSDLFRKIAKADVSYPKWISDSAVNLLQHIFDPNPKTRITLAEIQCHPWFSSGDPIDASALSSSVPHAAHHTHKHHAHAPSVATTTFLHSPRFNIGSPANKTEDAKAYLQDEHTPRQTHMSRRRAGSVGSLQSFGSLEISRAVVEANTAAGAAAAKRVSTLAVPSSTTITGTSPSLSPYTASSSPHPSSSSSIPSSIAGDSTTAITPRSPSAQAAGVSIAHSPAAATGPIAITRAGTGTGLTSTAAVNDVAHSPITGGLGVLRVQVSPASPMQPAGSDRTSAPWSVSGDHNGTTPSSALGGDPLSLPQAMIMRSASAPPPQAHDGAPAPPASASSQSDPIVAPPASALGGAIILNAFDLINMVSSAAVNRMFHRADGGQVKTLTQFTSKLPVADLLSLIETVLARMGAEVKVFPLACKVKCTVDVPKLLREDPSSKSSSGGGSMASPRGAPAAPVKGGKSPARTTSVKVEVPQMVYPDRFVSDPTGYSGSAASHHHASDEKETLFVNVQLYQMTPGLHIVEVRREQGDLLAFQDFYHDFRSRMESAEKEKRPPGASRPHLSINPGVTGAGSPVGSPYLVASGSMVNSPTDVQFHGFSLDAQRHTFTGASAAAAATISPSESRPLLRPAAGSTASPQNTHIHIPVIRAAPGHSSHVHGRSAVLPEAPMSPVSGDGKDVVADKLVSI